MARRGIFGGSFDPPHNGHLEICRCLKQKTKIDIVTWVPARIPPHKENKVLSDPQHRLKMTLLITENEPDFEVSTIEMDEKQPPWTIFLLEKFADIYPNDELHLLIGGDSLTDLSTWRDYRKLWELAEIDVAPRPDYDLTSVDSEILSNVRILDCPLRDISASDIRHRVSEGLPINELVPRRIENYILEHELYRIVDKS